MRQLFGYRKLFVCILVLLCVIVGLFAGSGSARTISKETTSDAVFQPDEKRACWISYIDIGQYLSDKSEAAFRAKVQEMYDMVKTNGMNTVIVHARAMGDAFYPSVYFPYSTYLSENRELPSYDPFEILVETAHEKGLMFEAWINPYRISMDDGTTDAFMQTDFYERYQSFLLSYTGQHGVCLALDPQKEETRNLIVSQIAEILSRYPVDGIHMDDYFYVDNMGAELTEKQKKEAVNQMLRAVYDQVKQTDASCTFGISPAGNPDYARAQGADIDRWLAEDGYVDYVMPQIYWTDSYYINDTCVTMFSDRCQAWKQLQKNNTKLYVGLALYRAGTQSEDDTGWMLTSDNLARQYTYAKKLGYAGFSLFRYAYLEDAAAQEELSALKSILSFSGFSLMGSTKVFYMVHMQTYGWQSVKADGIVAGNSKEEKNLEAVRICLGKTDTEGGVAYKVETGETSASGWVCDGAQAGTTGQSTPITGICIKLTGTLQETFDVCYRVYTSSQGWNAWCKNGDMAGKEPIRALQIRLVKKM